MKIDSVFVSRRTEEPEVVSPSEKKTQGYIPNFSYGINTSSTLGSELGTIESGNSYTATNPNSSAVGKYQFLWNTWKDSIKKQTGITTKEDFANNPQAQERYYSWYEQNHVLPEVAKLKAKGLGTNLSDKQLGKLVHYRGDKGASDYLQGKLSDKPETYNMSISKYIGKYAYGGNLRRMDIGGFLNSNKAGVTNVGSLVGTALQSDPDNAVTSTLGSTVSGAASGFGVAGPIGAAVGGGIGLITGLVNSAERKKQKAMLLRDKQNQAQAVMNQYSQQNWNMNMDMPKLAQYSYGGNLPQPKPTYQQWKSKLPSNLRNTDTTTYNLRGAYEGGLQPELNEDGSYHLGSRNPKTGELLKTPNHPTWNKLVQGEKEAGYEIYQKNGKNYSRPIPKYSYGGNLYEAEKHEVVQGDNIQLEDGKQLASDIHLVGGHSHEKGGTYGMGGDRVFSHRIPLTKEIKNDLKTLGITGKGSVAQMATKIGSMKGKMEDKLTSTNPIARMTGQIMTERYKSALDILFANQEHGKLPVYAYGGNLPKLAPGGPIPKIPNLLPRVKSRRISSFLKAEDTTKLDPRTMEGDAEDEQKLKPNYFGYVSSGIADLAQRSTIGKLKTRPDVSLVGGPIPKKRSVPPTLLPSVSVRAKRFITPIPTIENTLPKVGTNPQPLLPKAETLDPLATRTMKGDLGADEEGTKPNYFGYVSSGIADLAQRSTIGKLKTRPDVSLVGGPSYSYTDRSQGAKRDIAEQLATTVLPDRYKGQAFVASLKATGDINAQENARRDQYNANYSDQSFRTNAINSSIINQANNTELNNSNVKTQLAGEVTQGTLGNLNMIQAEKEKKILDAKRLALLTSAYKVGRTQELGKEVLDQIKAQFSYNK